MPKYKCINTECQLFDRELTIAKVKYVYDKSFMKLVPSEQIICSVCGEELEYIKPEGDITCTFGKFSSMSQEEKKAAMHKRSQEHFRRTDKGDLANYKRTLTDGMRRRALGQ